MSLRLTYEVISGDYPKMLEDAKGKIAQVATATMRQAGQIMKQDGRASIAGGGMSSRWQNALRVNVYPTSGASASPAALVYHKIPYAGQFEDPQTVAGKPLLWLPINQNLPLQARGKRWTPKDFIAQIGPLRGGKQGSKPILFGQVAVGLAGGVLAFPSPAGGRRAARQRDVYNKAKAKWLPVFVGVTAVVDPKKFDIAAVVDRVSDEIPALYAANWGSD